MSAARVLRRCARSLPLRATAPGDRLQGLLRCGEEHLVVDRLVRKSTAPRFIACTLDRDVAVAGEEDDRQSRGPARARAAIEAVHARHRQDRAPGSATPCAVEACRGTAWAEAKATTFSRPTRAGASRRHAHVRVVVDHVYDRSEASISGRLSRDHGHSKCIVAPPSGLLVAQIRPPWASTIVRQIASPRPSPARLVVTKGSNICSRSAGAMPEPMSATVTSTPPELARACAPPAGAARSRLHRLEAVHHEIEHHLLS